MIGRFQIGRVATTQPSARPPAPAPRAIRNAGVRRGGRAAARKVEADAGGWEEF
jgi:hypothetical protein